MLNSAKLTPAVHRYCAISEKIREGGGVRAGPSPGTATESAPVRNKCFRFHDAGIINRTRVN